MIHSKKCFLSNIYDESSKSSRHSYSWLVGKITLFPVIMICPRLWLRINDNQIRICFEFGRVLPISVFLLLSTTSLYQGYTVHNNLSCSHSLIGMYSNITNLVLLIKKERIRSIISNFLFVWPHIKSKQAINESLIIMPMNRYLWYWVKEFSDKIVLKEDYTHKMF